MRLPLVLALLAGPAAAHPHVFVASEVEVIADAEGQVAALRLTWTYDELFSLALVEDLGLDPDGDLALTEAERAALAEGMAWPPDFAGDLEVSQGGAPVALGPPEGVTVEYAGGVVRETHLRPLIDPAAGPIEVRNADPTYYVAYALDPDVQVSGPGDCEARMAPADPSAAQAQVDSLYAGLDWASAAPDVTLPPIGGFFADVLTVSCGG